MLLRSELINHPVLRQNKVVLSWCWINQIQIEFSRAIRLSWKAGAEIRKFTSIY